MEIDRKTELFNSLVEASLMPLVENSRDYFQILDTTELYVTLVNVIEELKSVVSQYAFGVNFNYYLCEKSDFYTDTIIREKVGRSGEAADVQLNALLKECGLLRLLQQMNSLSPPLSVHSIASPAVIEKGTQLLVSKMYLFINNEFYTIHPKLRTRMKLEASRMISSEYERLYNAVHDPQNGYINVDSIMLHTPQQIKTLLDCDYSVFHKHSHKNQVFIHSIIQSFFLSFYFSFFLSF